MAQPALEALFRAYAGEHPGDAARAPEALAPKEAAPLLHWTLGGPWFKAQRTMGAALAAEWFVARDEAFRLFE